MWNLQRSVDASPSDGRRVLIRRSELERWLAERTEGQGEEDETR